MNDSNLGKCLLAFAGGAIAGITLGVLFAPAKGTTTRRKIARKSHYAIESAKDKVEDIKDRMADLIDEIEDIAEHKVKKVFH